MIGIGFSSIRELGYSEVVSIYESYKTRMPNFESVFNYRNNKDTKRSVVGKILCFKLMEHYGLAGFSMAYETTGKPFLKGNTTNLYLSISHSDELVVVAISSHEIGIDIECMRHISEEAIEGILSFEIANAILTESDWNTAFYEHWTKTEALFKCIGSDFHVIRKLEDAEYIRYEASFYWLEEIYFEEAYKCYIAIKVAGLTEMQAFNLLKIQLH